MGHFAPFCPGGSRAAFDHYGRGPSRATFRRFHNHAGSRPTIRIQTPAENAQDPYSRGTPLSFGHLKSIPVDQPVENQLAMAHLCGLWTIPSPKRVISAQVTCQLACGALQRLALRSSVGSVKRPRYQRLKKISVVDWGLADLYYIVPLSVRNCKRELKPPDLVKAT